MPKFSKLIFVEKSQEAVLDPDTVDTSSLISSYESKLRKLEHKYKREIEILEEKLFVSAKPKDDVSKISDKIRAEYIAAIETLQANLASLKVKYQNEAALRKEEADRYRQEIKGANRKIKLLEQEIEVGCIACLGLS